MLAKCRNVVLVGGLNTQRAVCKNEWLTFQLWEKLTCSNGVSPVGVMKHLRVFHLQTT